MTKKCPLDKNHRIWPGNQGRWPLSLKDNLEIKEDTLEVLTDDLNVKDNFETMEANGYRWIVLMPRKYHN